jgi:hypothetical protein
MDVDGVDDAIDRCPETPFDELVDKNGCAKSEKIDYGELTLKIGTDIFIDKSYDNDNSLNLYLNYKFKSWDISISNSRSTTNSSYSEDNSYSSSDIYILLGEDFVLDKNLIKLSIGTKIAGDISDDKQKRGLKNQEKHNRNSNRDLDNSRDRDYFGSINYDYLLDSKKSIFLYYGYTISGDNKNYSSFALGAGYMFTQNLYSAFSYNYTGSTYIDEDGTKGINWFNSYNFTKNIFGSLSYSYALDKLSYDNTLSISLGFIF